MQPQRAIRVSYKDGYITMSPGERPWRWDTLTRGGNPTLTRLSTAAGHGEWNAVYRLQFDVADRDHDWMSGVYLVYVA